MAFVYFRRLRQTPFLLVTSILATCAWGTAFGGACTLKVLNGAWWVIVYEFVLVAGHIAIFLSDTISQYRLAMLTLLAVSIPLLTIQIDYVVQYTKPSIAKVPANVYAAGYIVLVIIQYLWVVVLGSEPSSFLGRFGHPLSSSMDTVTAIEPETKPLSEKTAKYTTKLPSNHFTEQRSPPLPQQQSNQHYHQTKAASDRLSRGSTTAHKPATVVVDFTEKVEALHAYQASPHDPNELSFEKGEVLEVVDRKGNWWQARKKDGAVGIIPSNYFAVY